MKLTILGGGGFRVPLVYRAAVAHGGPGRPDVVTLFDTSAERLDAIARVLDDGNGPDSPPVETTTELAEALDGADFVFAAIRVGGLAGRVADERVALDLGVLGQETTGPGGVAFGLRTVPAMLDIAAAMCRHAPDAWMINFTNPAGMITEALQAVLGERAIGICDSPMGLVTRAQRALGTVDAGASVGVDYAGLNHLGWLSGLRVDGVDRFDDLLADTAALAGIEEGQLFGVEWLRTLGAIPNEYLYYYDFTRDAIASITAAAETRAEFLLRSQADFYRRAATQASGLFAEWNQVRLARNATYMAEARGDHDRHDDDLDGGGYEGVAVAAMSALAGGPPATLILNVRNGDTQPALPPGAVIEVPCRVDATGATPLPVSPLIGERLGLVQQVKAVEQLTIAAAVEASEALAVHALAAHPLVDSVNVARALLVGYRARIPDLDRVFVGA
ncbi:MAG: 6-phospho-beta-glucosidase [Desertimonas sp.]